MLSRKLAWAYLQWRKFKEESARAALGGEWVEVRAAHESGTGNGKNWARARKGPSKLARHFEIGNVPESKDSIDLEEREGGQAHPRG